jgi:drug/metabolite transporter (DMT)-like permease
VIRVGLRGIPPFTGVAIRFAIAAAALLAVAPFFGVKLGRSRIERRLWWANALLTFCIPYSVLYWAEQWVPSGLCAVIFGTFPLLTALGAHFVLPAERLTFRGVVGIILGFAGVAVIFSEDFQALGGNQVAKAAAILLISPLSAALGNVVVKRWGGGLHPLSTAAVPMGMTALLVGALALLVESGQTVTFNTPSVLSILYLALIGSAFPFTVYFWLLRHQSATNLSMINYATPVLAVIVDSLFMGEAVTLRILIGSALVLVGVAVAVGGPRGEHLTPRSSADETRS